MIRSRTMVGVGLACTLFLAGCSPQPQDRPFQTELATATPGAPAPTAEANPGYPSPEAPAPDTGAYPAPGAAGQPSDPYPAPGVPTAGPTSLELEGRTVTALESYTLAQTYAQENFGNIEFYGIIPSHIMLQNLGNPPVKEGWFYKFKTVGTADYHFIQVVDGRVMGARTLTPLGEDEPQQAFNIDLVTIDSPAVFERFRARAAELGIAYSNAVVYDLELIYLPGNPAPIWSVVTPEGSQWIFSLNAVTGEETDDPRG